MKDFNIHCRVRNARLLRAMRASGFTSAAGLARAAGVSNSHVGDLLYMRETAFSKRSGLMYKPAAMAVAAALDASPGDLWPERLRDVRPRREGAEFEVNADEVAQIMAPHDPEKRAIQHDLLRKLIPAMAPRNAKAVALITGGATLAEAGQALGVGAERARQIYHKGLRQMRGKACKLGLTQPGEEMSTVFE